jgi:hypothetical protein
VFTKNTMILYRLVRSGKFDIGKNKYSGAYDRVDEE